MFFFWVIKGFKKRQGYIMKRKVNKVGPGTFTVSLPKKWIERQKLKKGDEIEILEKGNSVVLCSSVRPKARKIKIHIPCHERTILRILYHSYKSGADEVELTFDNQKCVKMVEENIDRYIGFEIIEQTEKSLLIKNITEINEKDFEKTFKRLFELTLFFSKKTYENISQLNFSSLSNTILLEKTQNKLYLFCLRALNLFRENLTNIPTFYYLLVQGLENIGDSYKFICDYYSKNPPKKLSKETLKFFEEVNQNLNLIHEMFYNFSIETNTEVLDTYEKLKEKTKKLLKKQPRGELFLISQLEKIIIDIVDTSSPIFGINFEKEISKISNT